MRHITNTSVLLSAFSFMLAAQSAYADVIIPKGWDGNASDPVSSWSTYKAAGAVIAVVVIVSIIVLVKIRKKNAGTK